jgi:hypothetical protein
VLSLNDLAIANEFDAQHNQSYEAVMVDSPPVVEILRHNDVRSVDPADLPIINGSPADSAARRTGRDP